MVGEKRPVEGSLDSSMRVSARRRQMTREEAVSDEG
jgi:hypothetical protein